MLKHSLIRITNREQNFKKKAALVNQVMVVAGGGSRTCSSLGMPGALRNNEMWVHLSPQINGMCDRGNYVQLWAILRTPFSVTSWAWAACWL